MPCAPILGNREHYRPTQGSVRLDCGLGRQTRRREKGQNEEEEVSTGQDNEIFRIKELRDKRLGEKRHKEKR